MSSRYRPGKRPQIPQDQLPDYEMARARLREANFDVAQLVITLAYIGADPLLADYVCRKLRAVVVVMRMALQVCEGISSGDFGPRNVRVQFRVTPPCDCGGRREEQEKNTPTPVTDPTWAREVELLLSITEAAARGLANSVQLSAETARGPLACLMALYKIVMRQQQHVALMGSSTQVGFIISQQCVYCGQVPAVLQNGGLNGGVKSQIS